MAALDIDLSGWLKRRAERAQANEKQGLINRALVLAATRGANPSAAELAQVDPLAGVEGMAGVSGTDPAADHAREIRNEELNLAVDRNRDEVTGLQQAALLAQAGVNPQQVAAARDTDARLAILRQTLGGLTPAARANAANQLDVSPVRSGGGVTYDRFNTARPVLEESSALEALARERSAAADDTDARSAAVRQVLDDPTISPLVRADVANQRTVSTPQQVKVQRPDGSAFLAVARRNPSGGYDFERGSFEDGETVRPLSEAGDGTALQRDAQWLAQVYGVSLPEAAAMKLESKNKSPRAVWEDIGLRLLSAQAKFGAKPDDLREMAEGAWSVLRPGEPPPVAALPGEGAPAPDAPAPDEPVPEPPAAAGRRQAARREGVTNLGRWLELPAEVGGGFGFEVLDETGQVKGYFR